MSAESLYTKENLRWRDLARSLAREVVLPVAWKHDRIQEYPWEVTRRLAVGDLLHVTLVHATITDGDTFFPDWRGHFTREISRRESSDANWRYTFLTLGK